MTSTSLPMHAVKTPAGEEKKNIHALNFNLKIVYPV